VPDGWAQIIDDWAQARLGPPLVMPLSRTPASIVTLNHFLNPAAQSVWGIIVHAIYKCYNQEGFRGVSEVSRQLTGFVPRQ